MAHAETEPGPATRQPTRPVDGRHSIPRVPAGLVPRPRLLRRVDDGIARGLVLVSGPPGAGKTLLLAHWAEQHRPPPSWLEVEPEDAEPDQFWARLLDTLQDAPGVPPDSRLGALKPPPQFDQRFVSLLVDACQDLPAPVVLVVDDLHQLEGTASLASLAEAIRRGLGNLRLVLSTRVESGLPKQRLRLEGALTEITADDLAFDAGEAALLLAQYGLHLAADRMATLLARTEGWATGIRLAAAALSSGQDVDQALEELAGDHRDVADFFVEEVLDQVEPDLVRFLSATCVPRRVCADLANRLSGREDGQALLDRLERDNLFVIALDDRRAWYRYHHLFGDLLRHRLTARSPERMRALHRIAARWFAEHDEPLEAARHLAEAGDWRELARFMIRTAGAHMLDVQRHALVEVLQRVPADLVLEDPEVATAAGIASYARYDAAGVHAHAAQARRVLGRLDGLDAEITDAVLVTMEAVAAWMEGDAEREIVTATEAIEKLGALPPAAVPAVSAYRGGAGVVLGMGSLWSGQLDAADAVLTRMAGVLEHQQTEVAVLEVHTHGHLAVLRSFQGRLREAEQEAGRALGVAERSGWLFLSQSGMALLAQAVVHLLRADDAACAEAVARCRAALDDFEDRLTLTGALLVRARMELDRGEAAAASALLEELRRRTTDWRMPWFLERWCELVELEVALAAGRQAARDALLARLAGDWGAARPEAQRVALVARAHLAAGRPEESLRLLTGVTEGPPVEVVPAVDAWVVTALAHDRLRHDAEAGTALDRALALAQDEEIVRPFVLSGDRMRGLLERHSRLAGEHQPFVERLLARMSAGEAGPAAVSALSEPLTDREASVLQLLPTMMTNAEIASELYVSVNTVKVHLKSLYRKLGVGSRRQAVVRARELGLLGTGTTVPA